MLLLFLSAALSAPHFDSNGITPEVVNELVKKYGAKKAVQKLADRHPADTGTALGDYDRVLDGVASGDPRWLALVPRLAPGTDAGTAEAIPIALAEALPKNPAGILRLINRDESWLDACSYPVIEPTRREIRAYFRVAIPAVRKVSDPALRHARGLCLTELVKAQHAP